MDTGVEYLAKSLLRPGQSRGDLHGRLHATLGHNRPELFRNLCQNLALAVRGSHCAVCVSVVVLPVLGMRRCG